MKTIIPSFNLDRFLQQVSDRIGPVGSLAVSRPIDASRINAVCSAELNAASARFRLNVVRRLSGTSFEFTRRSG